MTITHHVHCDACERMLGNGPARQPVILTLTQDVQEPASLTHWHFCHQGCLASWLTKAVKEHAAAKAGPAPASGDTGQDAARTGGTRANAN